VSKTLVTGATGFTGTALCKRLRAEGHDVLAFVRSKERAAHLIELGVECVEVDIRDRQQVRDAFTDIDRVFHLAAAWRTEHAELDEFRLVNVEATRHLLEAAQDADVEHFLHCSTVGVHGGVDEPPADESYRNRPQDHYQSSKLEGELIARRYFGNGLKGTVIRPVGIYGPGDVRFLKLFRPISRRRFVMVGTGQTLYHLTYIDDLLDGMLAAAHNKAAEGEVLTLAGESYTTIQELADMIADVLDKPVTRLRVPFSPVYYLAVLCDKVCRSMGIEPPLYPRRVEFFYKHRAFRIDKARNMIGYSPKVCLEKLL